MSIKLIKLSNHKIRIDIELILIQVHNTTSTWSLVFASVRQVATKDDCERGGVSARGDVTCDITDDVQ